MPPLDHHTHHHLHLVVKLYGQEQTQLSLVQILLSGQEQTQQLPPPKLYTMTSQWQTP